MRVQDATAAVRAFLGERKPQTFTIELRAPVDELLDGGGPFFDERMNGVSIAKPVTGGYGVLLVQLHLVVIAQRDGDPTLSVFRRGFPQRIFGDNQHLARLRQFDGRAQPGHARANHKEIRMHRLLR